jgi:hypothetical protein
MAKPTRTQQVACGTSIVIETEDEYVIIEAGPGAPTEWLPPPNHQPLMLSMLRSITVVDSPVMQRLDSPEELAPRAEGGDAVVLFQAED